MNNKIQALQNVLTMIIHVYTTTLLIYAGDIIHLFIQLAWLT